MIATLAFMLMFVGLASAIDRIMLEDDKAVVAGYLLKSSTVSFSAFESRVISSAISLFLNENGDLKCSRVFAYTFTFSACFYIIGSVIGGLEWNREHLVGTVTGPLILSYLSFPSDIFSLWITKKCFYKKTRRPIGNFFVIVLDIAISSLFVVGFAFILCQTDFGILDPAEFGIRDGAAFAAVTVFGSAFVSVGISLLQIVSISCGIILRTFLSPVIISSKFVFTRSRIEDYPLTVLTCFFTILAVIVSGTMLFFEPLKQHWAF